MKVQIIDILEKDNEYYVELKSNYGTIWAEWKDGKPILYKYYYVEFSVEEPLQLNKNLFINKNNRHSLFMENGKVVLNGWYDSLDEDGCLAIRIGESLILLDYINNKNQIANCKYKLVTSKNKLCDFI